MLFDLPAKPATSKVKHKSKADLLKNNTETTGKITSKHVKKVRDPLHAYLEKLKEADALHHSAERTKPNVRPSRKSLWDTGEHNNKLSSCELKHRKAESAYERALEILEELLGDYPWICTHLDRPVNFQHEPCNVSPDAYGVPRFSNSRSRFTIKDHRKF